MARTHYALPVGDSGIRWTACGSTVERVVQRDEYWSSRWTNINCVLCLANRDVIERKQAQEEREEKEAMTDGKQITVVLPKCEYKSEGQQFSFANTAGFPRMGRTVAQLREQGLHSLAMADALEAWEKKHAEEEKQAAWNAKRQDIINKYWGSMTRYESLPGATRRLIDDFIQRGENDG